MRIERFEDIEAWQLARELTRKVYELTKKDKFARYFCLRRQIQDAAGSSMHNVAEGFDSETNQEFVRFFDMQNGPALKFKVSFTWQWINNTEQKLSFKMHMIMPDVPVPQFVVS